MYLIPKPHKCNKCGHIMKVDENGYHVVAGIEEIAICPVCWKKFLIEHVGVMIYIQKDKKNETNQPNL